jgi:type II secretory ATPase GspE/PulE/Tfp pilus assembly ATPase PilB-like protein
MSSETIDFTEDLPVEATCVALLDRAATIGASDLLLLSDETEVVAAVRHLGMVVRLATYTPEMGQRLIRHTKVEAGMDLTERRRPLDGRWLVTRPDGRRLDVRVNSLPTLFGEDICMRLMDGATQRKTLESLGLSEGQFRQMLPMLHAPSGLLLVTGPTGSGKSTTLYSCLSRLNDGQRKINTIEDPVEYWLTGMRQSQINPTIDLGFADLLRAVMRQAPDVIMIGEIRDPETATTAVRAANSGHLVLATLHAPIAAAAVQSMLGLGVLPHFLATSLLGVISQRLVRVLCLSCRTRIDMSGAPQAFAEVQTLLGPGEGGSIFGAGGCEACLNQGYSSRVGVFEVMSISSRLRELVAAAADTSTLNRQALADGMLPLRHAALLHVASGVTTVEEVFRAVPTEYLGIDEGG